MTYAQENINCAAAKIAEITNDRQILQQLKKIKESGQGVEADRPQRCAQDGALTDEGTKAPPGHQQSKSSALTGDEQRLALWTAIGVIKHGCMYDATLILSNLHAAGFVVTRANAVAAQDDDTKNLIPCGCGDLYVDDTFGAGYLAAKGHCENCEAAALAATQPQPSANVSGVTLYEDRARRIYVAGPMTGLEELNFPAFNAAAKMLRDKGWHVENPADHGEVPGAEWADYLAYDLTRIGTCGAIYLLPGWEKSKGARLEVHVALALGMEIIKADGAAEPTGYLEAQAKPVSGDDALPTGDILDSQQRILIAAEALRDAAGRTNAKAARDALQLRIQAELNYVWSLAKDADQPQQARKVAQHCATDVCQAARQDGVLCANDECDRVNGVRPEKPSGDAGELPDSVRMPLDGLYADAAYLVGSVLEKRISRSAFVSGINSRIEAIRAALYDYGPLTNESAKPATIRNPLTVELSGHNLKTSKGGRGYVAEYFSKIIGRHDFTEYINGSLAADFACALAQHLAAQPIAPPQKLNVEAAAILLTEFMGPTWEDLPQQAREFALVRAKRIVGAALTGQEQKQ